MLLHQTLFSGTCPHAGTSCSPARTRLPARLSPLQPSQLLALQYRRRHSCLEALSSQGWQNPCHLQVLPSMSAARPSSRPACQQLQRPMTLHPATAPRLRERPESGTPAGTRLRLRLQARLGSQSSQPSGMLRLPALQLLALQVGLLTPVWGGVIVGCYVSLLLAVWGMHAAGGLLHRSTSAPAVSSRPGPCPCFMHGSVFAQTSLSLSTRASCALLMPETCAGAGSSKGLGRQLMNLHSSGVAHRGTGGRKLRAGRTVAGAQVAAWHRIAAGLSSLPTPWDAFM